eukprot:9478830-Pyramimonas_sp.AAC.1
MDFGQNHPVRLVWAIDVGVVVLQINDPIIRARWWGQYLHGLVGQLILQIVMLLARVDPELDDAVVRHLHAVCIASRADCNGGLGR